MMNEKKETSLGMFINENEIRVRDLVSYERFDKINKNRYEPLFPNLWIVKKFKRKYGEIIIVVNHFKITGLIISDKIDYFKKELLI